MILKKKVNQYADEIMEVEVLDKEELRAIMKDLDLLDIFLEVMDIAYDRKGTEAESYAVIDITTGEIVYGWVDKDEIEVHPNIYIDIARVKDVEVYKDNAKAILYNTEEELKMYKTLTGDWIKMEHKVALDHVIKVNNINVDSRLRDFCFTEGLDTIEFNPNASEDLDKIYREL